MKRRFGFDEQVVNRLERFILAVSERIVNGLIDRVIAIALGGIDMRDRMAGGASDAGLGSGMLLKIEIGVVERAAEERNDVVAARAPAGRFYVAVAFEDDLARFANRSEVSRIVERAEPMRAVKPIVVDVLWHFLQ